MCSRPYVRGWIDVLVRTEQVVRVVGSLDGGQARVVLPVGRLDSPLAFITQVVHVHRLLQVRLHRLEQGLGPLDVAIGVGRVRPLRADEEVVLLGALWEGGSRRGDTARRSGARL